MFAVRVWQENRGTFVANFRYKKRDRARSESAFSLMILE